MGGESKRYDSYEEMYESLYLSVLKYVRRMIRNNDTAVEDLTQEVFFVAYQKWDTVLKDHPNIPGFLMVVARNKIKKWFEKQSRIQLDEVETLDLFLQGEEGGDGIDAFNMVDFYSSVENTLSDRDLNILRHYYEYGYTSSEMAKRLGITESCFKVRVARMKEKLKSSMKVLIFMIISYGVGRFFQ